MNQPRLLTEILRPKRIDQLILPDRIRKIIGDGELKQNLLLYGSAGIGKTSAAKVLAHSHPYIYINCSDETSVDIIRDRINKFCSTLSVMDGEEAFKVVIMDELEGVSEQFFKALRGTIEKFAEHARFIATTNFINKIPDPVQSRFEPINFDFISNEEEEEVRTAQLARVRMVLTKMGISFTEDAIEELVKRTFPDMRKLFNRIQTLQHSKVKVLDKDAIMKTEWSYAEVFELCVSTPNPLANYKFLVGQYSSKVDDVLAALGDELPNWLEENHPEALKFLPQVIYEIALHQAQRVQVIDSTISMLSCIFKLQALIATKPKQ